MFVPNFEKFGAMDFCKAPTNIKKLNIKNQSMG